MKVTVVIEKTIFEEKVVEVDDKYNICANNNHEMDSRYKLAQEAAKALGIPLYSKCYTDRIIRVLRTEDRAELFEV